MEIQYFMGKTNFLFGTLLFSPWAILAMRKNKNSTTHFEQKFTIRSYGVGI
jgi:hypothetical protein